MIHALKHTAIRIWLTILIGSLIALAGLPSIQLPLRLEWAFGLAAPVFVAVFYAIGWLFNRSGMKLVQRLINEASVWERAGKTDQAEKLLRKAVAVFDSFLISPFHKERHARGLTGHMARFYLTQTDIEPEAENAILAYLKARPQDQAVAEAWLQRLESRDRDTTYEDLLFSLGKTHKDNPTIQTLIARRYLSTGRTDFQALQTYRRFMENTHAMDGSMVIRMAELFFKKRRLDAWAMQAYLAAYKLDRKKGHLIQGIAACLHETQAAREDSKQYHEARVLISGIDKTSLRKMIAEFKPVTPLSKKSETPPKARWMQRVNTATLHSSNTDNRYCVRAVLVCQNTHGCIWTHPGLPKVKTHTQVVRRGAGPRRSLNTGYKYCDLPDTNPIRILKI